MECDAVTKEAIVFFFDAVDAVELVFFVVVVDVELAMGGELFCTFWEGDASYDLAGEVLFGVVS